MQVKMGIICWSILINLVSVILTVQSNVGELAKKKCDQYAQFTLKLQNSGHKGIKHCDLMLPLIIGGTKVERTEFPHMAAIGFGHPSDLAYLCGGSLISNKFVMSAAHCTKDRVRGPARVVRLGSISLSNGDDHTHMVQIAKIYSHPDYKPSSKYNDIALMRLDRNIHFNEFIRPACINVNNDVKWTKAVASGFGLTSTEFSVGSNDLLKVELNKIPLNKCQRTYKASRFMSLGIIESQFCAGDLAGNKDTCQGDSGGPLQILHVKPYCVYSVIGITSFGKSCGFENTPAIYTNVAYYTNWIEDIVWKNITHD